METACIYPVVPWGGACSYRAALPRGCLSFWTHGGRATVSVGLTDIPAALALRPDELANVEIEEPLGVRLAEAAVECGDAAALVDWLIENGPVRIGRALAAATTPKARKSQGGS